jgi:hypothetical protein
MSNNSEHMSKTRVSGETDEQTVATDASGQEPVPINQTTRTVCEESQNPSSQAALKEDALDHEWPDAVACEMAVDEWTTGLENADLTEQYRDVLDGFKNGFSQGIPEHSLGPDRPFYTPENHKTALQARGKIEAKFEEEIAAKRMYGPYTHKQVAKHFRFFQTNPLGAVTNGNESFRPTNNLSYPHRGPETPSVNSFVDSKQFQTTWDDFRVVSSFLRAQEGPVDLAIFNWAKAYRQIPTAPDQWKYLMIKTFDNKLIFDTRITFGGVAGCGSFGRPADAWTRIMQHEFDLITIFRWVDDNLLVRSPLASTTMDKIVERSNKLGVKTNKGKFSPFETEQKFIGFIWNGHKKTVRLPDGKIFDCVSQVKEFMAKTEVSYKDIEVIVGRLNHVAYILPQLCCYLCSLYQMLKSWTWHTALRLKSPEVNEDLDAWLHALVTFS